MEDADDVVDRRVVGPLLVPLVEAVELRENDPAGQAGREERELAVRGDAVGGLGLEQPRRQDEGDRQPDDVRDQQRAPDEPAAPERDRRVLPLVQDLQRPGIELEARRLDRRSNRLCPRVRVQLSPPPSVEPTETGRARTGQNEARKSA